MVHRPIGELECAAAVAWLYSEVERHIGAAKARRLFLKHSKPLKRGGLKNIIMLVQYLAGSKNKKAIAEEWAGEHGNVESQRKKIGRLLQNENNMQMLRVRQEAYRLKKQHTLQSLFPK